MQRDGSRAFDSKRGGPSSSRVTTRTTGARPVAPNHPAYRAARGESISGGSTNCPIRRRRQTGGTIGVLKTPLFLVNRHRLGKRKGFRSRGSSRGRRGPQWSGPVTSGGILRAVPRMWTSDRRRDAHRHNRHFIEDTRFILNGLGIWLVQTRQIPYSLRAVGSSVETAMAHKAKTQNQVGPNSRSYSFTICIRRDSNDWGSDSHTKH